MAGNESVVKVIVRADSRKGRCLYSLEDVAAGDTLFEESPLVSAQFSWNAIYKYEACEYCMRSIETAEMNARRLARSDDLVLPHPECCETRSEDVIACDNCPAKYCCDMCKNIAYSKYHKTLCCGRNAESHPLNQLDEAWRNIHYPPETSSITLLTKLIAMVKQADDKKQLLSRISTFCNRAVNEEEQILHKLMGKEFSGQLDMLREMLTAALYDEAVEQWFTPQGFQSMMAMIGTNGQGIGTSSLSIWVRNCDELDLEPSERKKLDDFIDAIYKTIEHADKIYSEDGMEDDCGGDAFLNCEGSGLYELQSAANHSCDPNAEVTFPFNNSTLRFVATKEIKEGEEVFISYLDDCMRERSRHSRQKYLRENYLFQCNCTKCDAEAEQPEETSDESDSERGSDSDDVEMSA